MIGIRLAYFAGKMGASEKEQQREVGERDWMRQMMKRWKERGMEWLRSAC